MEKNICRYQEPFLWATRYSCEIHRIKIRNGPVGKNYGKFEGWRRDIGCKEIRKHETLRDKKFESLMSAGFLTSIFVLLFAMWVILLTI